MLRIGLTGGIAAGKTSLSDIFRSFGVPVVDADETARALVMPPADTLDQLVEHFGAEILADDGTLQRRVLRQKIFSDATERKAAETILHPPIRRHMLLECERLEQEGHPYALLSIALLVESNWHLQLSRVLVVTASEASRRQRIQARDQTLSEEAEKIIASQASDEKRLAVADDVVVNDGDPAKLLKAARRLHRLYLKLARDEAAGATVPQRR